MGIEKRKHKMLDSFKEVKELKWDKSNSSQSSFSSSISEEDLKRIEELYKEWDNEKSEKPIFSEQEAGKVTINCSIQEKESMEEATERIEKELANNSKEIRSMIDSLFSR